MKSTPPPSRPDEPASSARVRIEKPIYGGAFLSRVEGKAIFVPMALPGEDVRVQVTQEKRGYASAEIDEIIAVAPERVMPECRHFGPCGGCAYQHANYATQLAFKEAILRETLERGGVRAPEEIRVLSAEPWRYRNRIRLAFDARGNVGYRSRRSHEIVPISECPISAPLLLEGAAACAGLVHRFTPATRPTGLSLFCNATETRLLATLFGASSARARFEEFAGAFSERIPALAGIELSVEGRGDEAQHSVAQWGARSIRYSAAGFEYRVDHGAFFQVNRWLVDALVSCVAAKRSGALAWDLFAGVGLFARQLASTFERVMAVESASAATAALAHNLVGTTARAVKSDALAFLRRNVREPHPDLIVVDPPRTGLGPEICAAIGEIAPSTVVYVSCDPATLARDLRALVASGFAIEYLTLADLFPQTFHMETVVLLQHASGRE